MMTKNVKSFRLNGEYFTVTSGVNNEGVNIIFTDTEGDKIYISMCSASFNNLKLNIINNTNVQLKDYLINNKEEHKNYIKEIKNGFRSTGDIEFRCLDSMVRLNLIYRSIKDSILTAGTKYVYFPRDQFVDFLKSI